MNNVFRKMREVISSLRRPSKRLIKIILLTFLFMGGSFFFYFAFMIAVPLVALVMFLFIICKMICNVINGQFWAALRQRVWQLNTLKINADIP